MHAKKLDRRTYNKLWSRRSLGKRMRTKRAKKWTKDIENKLKTIIRKKKDNFPKWY